RNRFLRPKAKHVHEDGYGEDRSSSAKKAKHQSDDKAEGNADDVHARRPGARQRPCCFSRSCSASFRYCSTFSLFVQKFSVRFSSAAESENSRHVDVHGFVNVLGSSTLYWYSRKFLDGRRRRSVILV